MVLKAFKIPFVFHDLASDEDAKRRWRRKALDAQLPGLLVHNEWRGTFEEFDNAVEHGELVPFLKMRPEATSAKAAAAAALPASAPHEGGAKLPPAPTLLATPAGPGQRTLADEEDMLASILPQGTKLSDNDVDTLLRDLSKPLDRAPRKDSLPTVPAAEPKVQPARQATTHPHYDPQAYSSRNLAAEAARTIGAEPGSKTTAPRMTLKSMPLKQILEERRARQAKTESTRKNDELFRSLGLEDVHISDDQADALLERGTVPVLSSHAASKRVDAKEPVEPVVHNDMAIDKATAEHGQMDTSDLSVAEAIPIKMDAVDAASVAREGAKELGDAVVMPKDDGAGIFEKVQTAPTDAVPTPNIPLSKHLATRNEKALPDAPAAILTMPNVRRTSGAAKTILTLTKKKAFLAAPPPISALSKEDAALDVEKNKQQSSSTPTPGTIARGGNVDDSAMAHPSDVGNMDDKQVPQPALPEAPGMPKDFGLEDDRSSSTTSQPGACLALNELHNSNRDAAVPNVSQSMAKETACDRAVSRLAPLLEQERVAAPMALGSRGSTQQSNDLATPTSNTPEEHLHKSAVALAKDALQEAVKSASDQSSAEKGAGENEKAAKSSVAVASRPATTSDASETLTLSSVSQKFAPTSSASGIDAAMGTSQPVENAETMEGVFDHADTYAVQDAQAAVPSPNVPAQAFCARDTPVLDTAMHSSEPSAHASKSSADSNSLPAQRTATQPCNAPELAKNVAPVHNDSPCITDGAAVAEKDGIAQTNARLLQQARAAAFTEQPTQTFDNVQSVGFAQQDVVPSTAIVPNEPSKLPANAEPVTGSGKSETARGEGESVPAHASTAPASDAASDAKAAKAKAEAAVIAALAKHASGTKEAQKSAKASSPSVEPRPDTSARATTTEKDVSVSMGDADAEPSLSHDKRTAEHLQQDTAQNAHRTTHITTPALLANRLVSSSPGRPSASSNASTPFMPTRSAASPIIHTQSSARQKSTYSVGTGPLAGHGEESSEDEAPEDSVPDLWVFKTKTNAKRTSFGNVSQWESDHPSETSGSVDEQKMDAHDTGALQKDDSAPANAPHRATTPTPPDTASMLPKSPASQRHDSQTMPKSLRNSKPRTPQRSDVFRTVPASLLDEMEVLSLSHDARLTPERVPVTPERVQQQRSKEAHGANDDWLVGNAEKHAVVLENVFPQAIPHMQKSPRPALHQVLHTPFSTNALHDGLETSGVALDAGHESQAIPVQSAKGSLDTHRAEDDGASAVCTPPKLQSRPRKPSGPRLATPESNTAAQSAETTEAPSPLKGGAESETVSGMKLDQAPAKRTHKKSLSQVMQEADAFLQEWST
ncbi:hypothetical protein MVES1_001916 [Malassezia vespertilionis]|uniref:Uncharacterized protein n=1 Tax=Malassezia vespertilionis TaxID=2020962 RepID=A0A2N1JD01_9BASI|nr:uncharacterized protein MVES1_001916 [Malassezia vespertilionis]PKI84425.1 hypothetical protein MVES_001817 [Malassezia vespertilionis]WFD06565.1 hypothetical protein MVES1_001916 [Malassezia vespertilionis]